MESFDHMERHVDTGRDAGGRDQGTLVDESFVFDSETRFVGSGWNGLLVVQDLPGRETADLEDQRSIKILQAGEVSHRLEDVVKTALEF